MVFHHLYSFWRDGFQSWLNDIHLFERSGTTWVQWGFRLKLCHMLALACQRQGHNFSLNSLAWALIQQYTGDIKLWWRLQETNKVTFLGAAYLIEHWVSICNFAVCENHPQTNKTTNNSLFGFGFHNLFLEQNYIRKLVDSKTEAIQLPRSLPSY